jgi:hypothetical protein
MRVDLVDGVGERQSTSARLWVGNGLGMEPGIFLNGTRHRPCC